VPKKRFGQHFLSDTNILRRIVTFAGIHPDDSVVEIGPGHGNLTKELAAVARQVVAIEVDRDLIAPLRAKMPSKVTIIEADALTADLSALLDAPFHIVGNLPYNVATPLFKRFIEFRDNILDVTVMIQREVADRIVAKPGDDAYGPLTLLIQHYTVATFGFVVKPGAFRPPPKVDSAVIRLEWRPGVADSQEFTDFVHNVFASRRQKLINNLTRMFPDRSRDELMDDLRKAGTATDVRPENLSLDDYQRLFTIIRFSRGS
jgi:16S rRNA (adenine1518-N6/adenine1519-N6)-dimethyltransferase